MKLLLDTHTTLWFFGNVEKLPKAVFQAILDPTNEKYVSMASAWELAIKIGLGKLVFEGGVERFLCTIGECGFVLLPIKEEYVKQLETLPLLHRDPFDRMLIVSAMTENMCLLTADTNIRCYSISSLW